MELRRYLAVLRSRVLIIAVCVVVGLAAGYASAPKRSSYTATAKIYVGATRYLVGAGATGVSNDLLAGIQHVVETYAFMIDSEAIAEDAVHRVPGIARAPGRVLAETAAEPIGDTSLLAVRVTDPDPSAAQQLSNAMADAFVDRIQTYDPSAPPQEGQPPQLPAYVFERATLPGAPQPLGITRRVILGGMFGFLLSAAAVFLLEYIDITVKSPADVEQRLELPVLGVIPVDPAPFGVVSHGATASVPG